MSGVQRLIVVDHPLASNPEDGRGPGVVQRSADFLRSFGVTPEVSATSAVVGAFMQPSLGGVVKGFLVGSLVSLAYNHLSSR